jgi:hypothetical protein
MALLRWLRGLVLAAPPRWHEDWCEYVAPGWGHCGIPCTCAEEREP